MFPRKDSKKYKVGDEVVVKDRNEPCTIVQVVEVVAALKGVSVDEICEHAWANTIKMFNI